MKRVARGFTLIELVAAIVLLSAGTVALIGMYGTVGRNLSSNQDIQTAAQLAQECSEYIIAARRSNVTVGYAGVTGATFCSAALPVMTGYTVTTNITNPYAVNCPTTCKRVDIVVTKSGNSLAGATLTLVNY